jgi:hypothetical protein
MSTAVTTFYASDGTARLEIRAPLGANNTFVGQSAGRYNTTGLYNTGLGYLALGANTTGEGNVAIGRLSMYQNTTGSQNVVVGSFNLIANLTGGANVSIGYNNLNSNTSGGNNIAIGNATLPLNVTGSNTVAMGFEALYSSTAGSNVAVGQYAGRDITTGYYNVFLGVNSGYSGSQMVGAINTVAIGLNSYTTKSNQVVLGGSAIVETLLRGIVLISADGTGIAGTVGLSNVVNETLSSGTGTIKMAGATNRDSSGWLKIYNGVNVRYIPYFTDITG